MSSCLHHSVRPRPRRDRASPRQAIDATTRVLVDGTRDWVVRVEIRARGTAVRFVEHGAGRPVLVLHGAGVDHREPEACFEPVFAGVAGFRRIYPDLPGMGTTVAGEELR